jgi:hypothetical protein
MPRGRLSLAWFRRTVKLYITRKGGVACEPSAGS